jgi:fatty acid desaturase
MGAGTRVTAVIPLTASEPRDEPVPQPGATRVLPTAEAEALQRQRLHNLGIRAAALGIVAGVLVAIWALTGPDLPWIVWPLLGIGLIAGLDAWRVYSAPPLREAELAGADDRAEALRKLVPSRRFRHHAGAQVILNVFIVGVWLAAGNGYFWPAWVMLGSAIAIGLNALPRPARAHRSLLGDYP